MEKAEWYMMASWRGVRVCVRVLASGGEMCLNVCVCVCTGVILFLFFSVQTGTSVRLGDMPGTLHRYSYCGFKGTHSLYCSNITELFSKVRK